MHFGLLSLEAMSGIVATHSAEDFSATSPGEDSDVAGSPVQEIEPIPGLNGVPVRCESSLRL